MLGMYTHNQLNKTPPVFSINQALTSIEIIKEAIERLIAGFTSTPPIPKLDLTVNVRTSYINACTHV